VNIIKKYYPYLTGLLVFIVYLFTLAPSVMEIDTGELATDLLTLGIAHPTGYPLFTIVGHLFSLIPLPGSGIYRMNLLAALWCSCAITVFVFISKTVLENIDLFQSKKISVQPKESKKNRKKGEKEIKAEPAVNTFSFSENIIILASVFGGLILAFDKTFWTQSTSIEVYSLHALLVMLVIYFLIKAYISQNSVETFSVQNKWLVFSVVLALCFSNHMTSIFILPGIAYFYFLKNKLSKNSIRLIGKMLLVFFPILMVIYSYLPIRALQNPIMNWSNPIDLERILRHISGKQYQVWLFTSFDAAAKQFSHFIDILFGNYLSGGSFFGEYNIGLFFIVIGILASFKYAKRFWGFLAITFAFTILYSINYEINDIDSYFLLGFISLAFFSVFGILWLIKLLKSKNQPYLIPIGIISVFILIQCFINFRENNDHNVHVYEDYTKSLIGSVDKNSLILSYQWDYFVSAAYYFQNVENYRKDVIIVDKELLRRSWYYNQIERNHPGIVSSIQPDVNVFLSALVPFERSEQFDPNLLETSYRRIMADLITSNIDKRSVYIGPELIENEMQNGSFSIPDGYDIVPDLFLFKVVKKDAGYVPAKNPDFTIRFENKDNKYSMAIENITGAMLVRRALYEFQHNKPGKAALYTAKIKKDFPDYVIPANLSKALGN
jgi:hypothetical protein